MTTPAAAGRHTAPADPCGRVRRLPDLGLAPVGTAERPPRETTDRRGSAVVPDAVPVPALRAAHAVVRIALEVVDRHRLPDRARAAFAPHLVEMLAGLAASNTPARRLGPARLHRVHVHPAGPGRGDGHRSYEIVATYTRGPRLFATAARIDVDAHRARCTAFRFV